MTCKKGHTYETVRCWPCQSETHRKWRERRLAEDPEWRRKSLRAWGKANPQKIHGYNQKWYWAHQKEAGERMRAYRERPEVKERLKIKANERLVADPKRVKARNSRSAEWRRVNREKVRLSMKQWAAANPDKMREHRAKRRARKLVAIEKFSPTEWRAVVDSYGGLCAYCSLNKWEHQDHVIALSRGGSHSIANVVPACADCNRRKGVRAWLPAEPYTHCGTSRAPRSMLGHKNEPA